MVKDNRIYTLVDDELYKKFRDYWVDKENRDQERISAAAVARELIEYALKHMNGKKVNPEASDSVIEKPVEPDKVIDAVQDTSQDNKQNPFNEIKF